MNGNAAPFNLPEMMDRLGIRPLMLFASIIAGIALGVQVWLWSENGQRQPLYVGLADRDAAKVARALESAGIPYSMSAGGTLEVPADRLREAKLKMAEQALPMGDSPGKEMLQQDPGFGVSQFVESARYQTALETELVRTVVTVQGVKNARVHLALSKESAFAGSQHDASASVLIELYPGRSLTTAQVDAIVHLVAGSVPSLPADRVTVIDQTGRLLSRNAADPALAQSSAQFDQIRALETSYAQRIERLLTPLTGPGRISTQVAVDMDFSVTEEAQETYQPDPRAVRSEQVSQDNTSANGTGKGGVPGARSNAPASAAVAAPAEAPAADGASAQNQSRRESRQYEIDRTVRHSRSAPGKLRRLSVAVLVDHLPKTDAKGGVKMQPLTKTQLSQIEALVKEAVGFDTQRGDTVAVTNQPFLREQPAPIAPLPLWERDSFWSYGKQGLGLLVLLVIAFGVLRPAMRNALKAAPVRALPTAAMALPGQVGMSDIHAARHQGPTGVPFEEKLALAKSAVAQDPKRVAQVMKTWVANDA